MKVLKAQMSVIEAINNDVLLNISNTNRRPMEREMERKFKRINHGRRSRNWKETSKSRKSFGGSHFKVNHDIANEHMSYEDMIEMSIYNQSF